MLCWQVPKLTDRLRDADDDVRSVAASTLVPITDTLATKLSESELSTLFDTLWDCLVADTDELGSSTGAVMDLLGESIFCPDGPR